jgi:hypothetical protein
MAMSRVDFSGRWQFAPDASTLQIARPDAAAFTIEHREPSFRLERTLTFGERSDTFAIELTVGTDRGPIPRGEAMLYPSLRWDGDDLVFFTRIVHDGEEATNLVRYRLEEDGTVLIAEESFRSSAQSYDNRWVFTRVQA